MINRSNILSKCHLKNKCFSHGLALIEVLISTVVISTGVLGVVFLLSHLVDGNIRVQQQDDALSLLNNKIESFKNNLTREQFSNIQSGQQDIQINHHLYHLSWQVIDKDKTQKDLSLSVKVDNETADLANLKYSLVWQDPLISASIASYGLKAGYSYLSPNPPLETPFFDSSAVAEMSEQQTLSNAYRLLRDKHKSLFVVDANDKVVFSLKSTGSAVEAMRQIQGRIFYPSALRDKFSLLVSEQGYCIYPINQQVIALANYEMMSYHCFMPNNWRGKIGIVALKDENNLVPSIEFCPAATRQYLRYQRKPADKLYLQGIIKDYVQQDFLLQNKASSLSCQTKVNELSEQMLSTLADIATNQMIFFQPLQLDDANVLSFSAKVIFNNIQESSLELSLATDIDHNCHQVRGAEKQQDLFYCVLAKAKNDLAGWQGNMDFNLLKKTGESCFFSLPINTLVAQQYEVALAQYCP